MAWVDFFRLSKFKYYTNGIILAVLEAYFFNLSQTLRYCPVADKACTSALTTLLVFNLKSILPIMIAAYLLTSLAEFLYRMFR